ncbi:hypothetical protein HY68_12835 [Streptomyces sp. AcH 505]|uniref:hypothetical protein n=1 Tax=Streptomyces sp. AcH 505 TaxID=352211 RepID=UPI0005923574|nr:hypothetical protein HY68_12835 [Streptomyces sp. AcH 505]
MPTLSRSVRALLEVIAQADAGDGVLFLSAPCGRWRMDGTRYLVNNRTFYPLDSHGLVDVGNGRTDPVRVTATGRAYLTGGTQ